MKIRSVFVIDTDGYRITTIADNHKSKNELMKIAKEGNFDGAIDYIYMDDGLEMMHAFEAGKIYKNGKMIDAPIIEPTKEELRERDLSMLENEYNAAVKDLSDAFMIARLKGDTVAEESIQHDFEELQISYKEEREEIENV